MITNIWKWIKSALGGLFSAAEREFNKLTPEQQSALIKSSGIVEIFNSMLTAAPNEVRWAIQEKFGFDAVKLEQAIFGLAKVLNLTGYSSLDECVQAIQNYLKDKTVQSELWGVISHSMACLLAIIIGPTSLKVEAAVSLMELVYRKYIYKPKLAVAA